MSRSALALVLPSCLLLLASANDARADLTAYLGVMTVGSARPAVGVAFAYCPSIVGFEVEYAGAFGDVTAGGIFVNVIVQTRPSARRALFYGVAGLGLYGETDSSGIGSGEVAAKDIGGGVKFRLANRLGLRLDYRVFLLGDAPDAAPGFELHTRPQRFSVGLIVTF